MTDSPRHYMESTQRLQDLGLQTITYNNAFQSRLDRETNERLYYYHASLAAAAVEHERIQRHAQRDLERLEQELIQRRHLEDLSQEEAEDKRRQEVLEREIADKRREIEEKRRAAEKDAVEARLRLEEEESQQRRQIEEAEKRRRLEEEQAPSSPTPTPRPEVQAPSPAPIPVNKNVATPHVTNRESHNPTHRKYLDLHACLKTMRKSVTDIAKKNVQLRGQLGDMRRKIKKCVGQLTLDSKANMEPLKSIRDTLFQARHLPNQPQIDARQFIISQPLPPSDSTTNSTIPSLFIYLLNIFAKAVIAQLISEAGVSPKTADPIGIVGITIFANNDLRWQGVSFIDILLAKFHVVCPVLFGVTGSEKTEQGRKRLGWHRDTGTGEWVTEQQHSERMAGLGAGFAALSLRDFSKSKTLNPLPPWNYWIAIAGIVNLRPENITQTHCMVLRAMIELHVARLVGFFGQASIAVLRVAVLDFPYRTERSVANTALATLQQTIKRDYRLTL